MITRFLALNLRMEIFLQNVLFLSRKKWQELGSYSIFLPQINGKNCTFFKHFTRLLTMFKKSGKKNA